MYEKENLKSQFVRLDPFKLQKARVAKIKLFINKTTNIFEETKSTALITVTFYFKATGEKNNRKNYNRN